ncbi:MAG: (Fe-S)-binding protein, partial [Myxococcota bacterium]
GERGAFAAAEVMMAAGGSGTGEMDDGSRSGRATLPLPGNPMFVAGAWRGLRAMLRAATSEGLELVVPWIDPVGGAGFLFGAGGEIDSNLRSRLMTLGVELGIVAPSIMTLDTIPFSPKPAKMGHVPRLSKGRLPVSTIVATVSEAKPVGGPRGEMIRAGLQLPDWIGALDNCTYCPKMCRFSCPVAVADGTETLTPRQLMLTANMHRLGLRALTPDVAARLWACVDCRGCRSFCDHGNDVASVLTDARSGLVAADAAPDVVRRYVEAFRAAGRPPDCSASDSAAAVLQQAGQHSGTWLFLGCQSKCTPDHLEPARAAMALCCRQFGSVHVLGGEVACCGMPLWRWGDHDGFAQHAALFASQLSGCDRLVVDDPGCAYALRELYPKLGYDMPAIFTITALLRQETWRPRAPDRWALHDSCYATRWLGEPGMRSLDALSGVRLPPGSVLEGESGCCGGMLLPFYDEQLAERVARACVHDLLGGGARRILTASPTCRRRLTAVGAPVDDLATVWHMERI